MSQRNLDRLDRLEKARGRMAVRVIFWPGNAEALTNSAGPYSAADALIDLSGGGPGGPWPAPRHWESQPGESLDEFCDRIRRDLASSRGSVTIYLSSPDTPGLVIGWGDEDSEPEGIAS